MSAQKIHNQTYSQNPPFQRSNKRSAKPLSIHWFWMGLGLTGIALLSATAGALLAVSLVSTPLMQTKLTPEEAAVFGNGDRISTGKNLRLPQLTRPVNILLLGTKVLTSDLNELPEHVEDLGYHALVDSFEGLSDTILLVRFDPKTKKLAVLSIPRDTRTWVEGQGRIKINEANYYGGPALAATSVSELLGGVPIDRFVRLNVQAIEKLVDALGGVKVYVPYDMKYQDDSQHLYINLKAGEQHLNGEQALQFLRYRNNQLGDIGRIQRQQLLMRSLMEQTLNPSTLAKLPQLLSIVQSHLDTNLSVEELFALVGFASQTDRANVEMLLTPGQFSDPEEFKASYWLPDYRHIDEMMAQNFGMGDRDTIVYDIDPAYLKVAIQDSTEDWDAVDDVVNTLYEQGYGDVYIDYPWEQPLKVTRIVAQYGDIKSAKAIRRVLGFGEVRVESTGNLRSDVTIQLGEDWLQQTRETTSSEGYSEGY